MPKPGNRAANRLVIRLVTAKLKAATQRLRNRIRRIGASRIARSEMTAVMITGRGAPGWGSCQRTRLSAAYRPSGSHYLFICLSKQQSYTLHMRVPVQN